MQYILIILIILIPINQADAFAPRLITKCEQSYLGYTFKPLPTQHPCHRVHAQWNREQILYALDYFSKL